ncbi:MAG: hypothetical protein RML40_02330 [Bacteroidota bacterium]|nr:hypothetical protein [Candidatus Kapabacteria bacterium]MDW8219347.1 hypothetical protein [Bacteroidota bacterium]
MTITRGLSLHNWNLQAFVAAFALAVPALTSIMPNVLRAQRTETRKPPSLAPAEQQRSLLEKPRQLRPQQIITADTATVVQDSTALGTTPPGEYPFTPEQDRAFYEALRIEVPPRVRFQFEARQFSLAWLAMQEARRQQISPQEAAIAAMNAIDPRAFLPTAQEQTFYNYGIAQSFTIPGVFDPFQRYGGLPGVGGSGVSVPLALIGSLLGLTDDVSPTIRYTVEQPAEVEIIIYSVQAIAIARILKAQQNAGGYAITWNLKNDQGLSVPPGDYIAEVRIGKDAVVRKRIRVG